MAVTGLIMPVPPGVCAHLHTCPSLQGPDSLCAPRLHTPTLSGVTEVAEEPPPAWRCLCLGFWVRQGRRGLPAGRAPLL